MSARRFVVDTAGVARSSLDVVSIPDAKVGLSTASAFPESSASAFDLAARLGYDGVEVMVWTDPVSQDVEALRRLSDYHGVPILAVHAPCLLITQRVWSTDPWTKLQRARAAAEKLGASAVVVHPPFRWQRQYAREFVQGVWRMADETDVRFRVLSNSESSTDMYRPVVPSPSPSMIESHDVRFASAPPSLYVLSGEAEMALRGAPPREVSNILSPRPGRAMGRSE